MSQIDQLLEALVKCQEGMDERIFWPCHPAQMEAYFSDLITLELLTKFRNDQQKFAQALDQVPVDILRFHLLDAGIVGLKVVRKYGPVKIDRKETFEFIGEIIASIKRRIKSDPFCLDGENKILAEEDLRKKLNGHVFIPFSDQEQKRILTEFNIAAEALTWALYFDLYRDAGMVIHGGYNFPTGKVIVRDFFDLGQQPSVSVWLLYNQNFRYFIDFANHIVYEGNHMDYLRGYLVLSKNKVLTVEEIFKLEENFSSIRDKLVAKIDKFFPGELIWEGAVRYWYLFKNFFAFYHELGNPPEEIKKRIKSWGLKYWHQFQPKEEKQNLVRFRKFYDPRNDFLG